MRQTADSLQAAATDLALVEIQQLADVREAEEELASQFRRRGWDATTNPIEITFNPRDCVARFWSWFAVFVDLQRIDKRRFEIQTGQQQQRITSSGDSGTISGSFVCVKLIAVGHGPVLTPFRENCHALTQTAPAQGVVGVIAMLRQSATSQL